jgi:hypothetical protein
MSDIVERLERYVNQYTYEVGGCPDGTLREAAAEITRLRTELAEAQAAREQTIKNWEADIRAMNANRDTLRQQLAVAREGLGEICEYKLSREHDEWGLGWRAGRDGAAEMARDTLTKLD